LHGAVVDVEEEAGMAARAEGIELTSEERAELERRARSHVLAHRMVVRAKVILLLAAGGSVSAVARAVARQRGIVRKGAQRFTRQRLRGLEDAPRSGRPAVFSPRGGHPLGQARL
jgi:hypothetical protein